jgi:uncharacterized membrane protein
MNYGNMRLLYVFSCVVLCFVVLTPLLAEVVPLPQGERFSEIWVLGPNHMIGDYPFDVSQGISYSVFLGVGNRMGSLQYYKVFAKLGNESDSQPDNEAGLPSFLSPVFEYDVFLSDNETWERAVPFSFDGVSFNGNVARVSGLFINNYAVNVNKVVVRNETDNAFYCQLFFELWLYNSTVSDFQFNDRWVGLWFNMTN